MSFFESLILLLLAAIVLLQVARRLSLPYPAMLAGAGVIVALIPGSPDIGLAPDTALALFIAPVLVDSAFDFPLTAARRLWAPLTALAVFAVLVTTTVVAWVGWAYVGLPVAAAVALGAIVSPPDAAAATAVLTAVSIPRSTEALLKGESLFNDASALLIFSIAVGLQANGGFTPGAGVRIALAVPGGLLLGIGCAFLARRITRLTVDTLGGNLLQFVMCYLVWIAAERLQLSAILCVIAFAMTLARSSEVNFSVRMRVHSYAVWSSVVFTLNVLVFLLTGMQARNIIFRMPADRLREALAIAVVVVIVTIATRMILTIGFNRLVAWRQRQKGLKEPATLLQAILVGWCGMRGFVTLATALALPASFPRRDIVVLIAFCVVLATLVVQGLTLAPLIRLLHLNDDDSKQREMTDARVSLAKAAIQKLGSGEERELQQLKHKYELKRDAWSDQLKRESLERFRAFGLASISAERKELERLRADDQVGIDMYLLLQEELDWSELTLLSEDNRKIVES